jgi:hypothetical protein
MVNILQKAPSFGEILGSGLGGGISQGIGSGIKFAQEMALNEAKRKKEDQVNKDAIAQQALGSLQQLKSLVSSPGVGMAGKWFNYSDEARRNRGEFEALTSGILPAFKSMFPRGFTEREFNVIRRDYIPQVGDTEAKIEGKIKGLEDIFSKLLSGKSWNEALGSTPESTRSEFSSEKNIEEKNSKTQFDPNNAEHKKKFKQLDKKFKGDRKKVNEALSREFY